MKQQLKKLYAMALQMIPVCVGVILTATANSTTCWLQGQDEPPSSIKKFRKF